MIQTIFFDVDYWDALEGHKVKVDKMIEEVVVCNGDSYLSDLKNALERKEISFFHYLNMRRDYINDKNSF